MSRAEVEAARQRLAAERERLAGLERELEESGSGPGTLRPILVLLALVIAALVMALVFQRRTPQTALPAERLARRDALRAEYEAEKRKVEVTAPAVQRPAPDPEAGIAAWAKIGRAACTVKQKELARSALRKLEFEGSESKRSAPDGVMRPDISRAIRQLDEHCRERGIHVLTL